MEGDARWEGGDRSGTGGVLSRSLEREMFGVLILT